MLGVLLIVLIAGYLAFLQPIIKKKEESSVEQKYSTQMKKLWSIAQTSMSERKPLRAEKALLTILKFDEKNAAAYNRLGILYAKEQKYDEAIECFEIAQSLDNNASCLHNVGLIYLETGAYEKAEMAFRQALKLEDDVSARYMALAKAEEKLGKKRQALDALEKAYELNKSTATLRQILALHEASGDTEAITATTARIEQQMAEDAKRRAEATKARMRKEAAAKAARTRTLNKVKAKTMVAKRTPRILYPKSQRAAVRAGVARASMPKIGAKKKPTIESRATKTTKTSTTATTKTTKTVAARVESSRVAVMGVPVKPGGARSRVAATRGRMTKAVKRDTNAIQKRATTARQQKVI